MPFQYIQIGFVIALFIKENHWLIGHLTTLGGCFECEKLKQLQFESPSGLVLYEILLEWYNDCVVCKFYIYWLWWTIRFKCFTVQSI